MFIFLFGIIVRIFSYIIIITIVNLLLFMGIEIHLCVIRIIGTKPLPDQVQAMVSGKLDAGLASLRHGGFYW